MFLFYYAYIVKPHCVRALLKLHDAQQHTAERVDAYLLRLLHVQRYPLLAGCLHGERGVEVGGGGNAVDRSIGQVATTLPNLVQKPVAR